MNYTESVDWLFHQFPAYQQIGESAYKPDLDNVLHLCTLFNVKHEQLKFIHVAGTNGKGSVCHFLASIFQEANYKSGLFTSPHLIDFRERILVDGEKIPEENVVNFCKKIQSSTFRVRPSFFEITFLMALEYFIEKKCQICIIETGLGGRLDATNIIQPILSVITSISFDHENILGNNLKKIAYEKAGIIKKNTPVVVGKMSKEVQSVISKKAKENLSLIFKSSLIKKSERSISPKNTYLYENERIVRAVCSVLKNDQLFNLDKSINDGIIKVSQNTAYCGRFQIWQKKPRIILDVAHNEAGIKELLKWIKSLKYEKLIVIFGSSKEKNWKKMLEFFPKEAHICISEFTNPRSIKIEELDLKTISKTHVFKHITKAMDYTKTIHKENDILLICGSFFLISDFFQNFNHKNFDN
ncbi:MAG: bifunctional folylpolyglutamate synthase/dihydrofolate synthase [Flavobacteriia bacterium]|nr:bifunctional folylpolyglutamate synthase/dihydrofolate synthase [Flavobacteriia bacterium]